MATLLVFGSAFIVYTVAVFCHGIYREKKDKPERTAKKVSIKEVLGGQKI